MMLFSNDRSDLAVRNQNGHYNVITDVRTAVPSLAGICPGAAATPGHTTACAEAENDVKWMQQTAAQSLTFCALVGEDGGRLGVGALRFVNFLASDAGSSMGERRPSCASLCSARAAPPSRGAARSSYVLVNECSPNGGQRGRSCHGSLPRVEPKCRPAATRTRARPTGYAAATPPLPPPMFPPQTTAARDPALDLHGAPVSFATGGASPVTALNFPPFMAAPFELKLGLIQTQMAQKPMFQTEVCARALHASQKF